MSMFQYIKQLYDFADQYPERIKPYHWAVYITLLEKCNRLSWKEKFGLPRDQIMELSGISHRKTYYNSIKDLEKWGFIKVIERSRNQNSATIISLGTPSFENKMRMTTSAQAFPKRESGSGTIIRLNKTNKDFQDNINNKVFLKKMILENENLLKLLEEKSPIKNSVLEKIDPFLNEKIASGDHLLWHNPNAMFKHYLNWFTKTNINSSNKMNVIKKAERR